MKNHPPNWVIALILAGIVLVVVAIAMHPAKETPPSPQNVHVIQGVTPGRWCVRAKDKAGNVSKPSCVTVPGKKRLANDSKRRLDLGMTFAATPNFLVDTGTDSGLPIEQQYTKVTFSVDGSLKKTVYKPPYSYSSPPAGTHKLVVTGYTADGTAQSRITQQYTKP